MKKVMIIAALLVVAIFVQSGAAVTVTVGPNDKVQNGGTAGGKAGFVEGVDGVTNIASVKTFIEAYAYLDTAAVGLGKATAWYNGVNDETRTYQSVASPTTTSYTLTSNCEGEVKVGVERTDAASKAPMSAWGEIYSQCSADLDADGAAQGLNELFGETSIAGGIGDMGAAAYKFADSTAAFTSDNLAGGVVYNGFHAPGSALVYVDGYGGYTGTRTLNGVDDYVVTGSADSIIDLVGSREDEAKDVGTAAPGTDVTVSDNWIEGRTFTGSTVYYGGESDSAADPTIQAVSEGDFGDAALVDPAVPDGNNGLTELSGSVASNAVSSKTWDWTAPLAHFANTESTSSFVSGTVDVAAKTYFASLTPGATDGDFVDVIATISADSQRLAADAAADSERLEAKGEFKTRAEAERKEAGTEADERVYGQANVEFGVIKSSAQEGIKKVSQEATTLGNSGAWYGFNSGAELVNPNVAGILNENTYQQEAHISAAGEVMVSTNNLVDTNGPARTGEVLDAAGGWSSIRGSKVTAYQSASPASKSVQIDFADQFNVNWVNGIEPAAQSVNVFSTPELTSDDNSGIPVLLDDIGSLTAGRNYDRRYILDYSFA